MAAGAVGGARQLCALKDPSNKAVVCISVRTSVCPGHLPRVLAAGVGSAPHPRALVCGTSSCSGSWLQRGWAQEPWCRGSLCGTLDSSLRNPG